MPLYVAHFLIKEENLWLNNQPPYEVLRSEEHHFLALHMFAAGDPEAAYSRALDMLPGLSDANHEGPGDRTHFEAIGIFDLDEVFVAEDLSTNLNDIYGVDIGVLDIEELLHKRSRAKHELRLFKYQTGLAATAAS
ncbi:hypothetical protein [Comamonas squillarum]|uniref:Uncharacterized protein n=1 Tax=Comamonas squillarum TaxID=2977320 RepID=A0ABY5ZVF6_9BURK|nr:hypothetical protein [Comamonas sp. PR12]UXC17967.1 hypothetical protein N4T19_20095 [Comamonas sp. PR12]